MRVESGLRMTKESECMRAFAEELIALYQGMSVNLKREIERGESTATKLAFLTGSQATLLLLNRRLEDMLAHDELDIPAEDVPGCLAHDQVTLAAVLVSVIRVADELFNVELSEKGWARLWQLLGRVETVSAKKGH